VTRLFTGAGLRDKDLTSLSLTHRAAYHAYTKDDLGKTFQLLGVKNLDQVEQRLGILHDQQARIAEAAAKASPVSFANYRLASQAA
jgi:citrate lyase synthetase